MGTGRKIIGFAACILIPLAAGAIGALFTTPAIPVWYAALTKPALTPPAWVFGPVWTLLYVLMGVALFLVWFSSAKATEGQALGDKEKATRVFFVQLILNIAWSAVFFGAHSPAAALLVIAALWGAIAAAINRFAKVSRPAAWLLTPYILWVTFASYLNLAIYLLNR